MADDAIYETRCDAPEPSRPATTASRPVSRGRYQLGVLIGRGGMATVVEARDTCLRRTVAVKRPLPDVAASAEALDRFYDEADLMAAIDHPGAVAVHDAGVLESGEPFYAMAKIQGRTLAALITENRVGRRRLDMTLVDVFQRVAETMGYAHAKGIIHRDLKPENVMVDTFGAVYVVDWGLGKRIAAGDDLSRTVAGRVLGTPAYMSPEAIGGSTGGADARSDVFALGAMFYEVLTGERPFHGRTLAEIVEDVRHHDPIPPRRVNPQVSRELSAICLKALAKDPAARYPAAGDLADDIRRARAYLPVVAAPPRPRDRARNWARRHPRAAAAIGTLTAAILVAAAVLAYALIQQRLVRQAMWDSYERTAAAQQAIEDDLDRIRAELPGLPAGQERLAAAYREAELTRRLELTRNDAGTTLGAMLGFSGFRPDARVLGAMTARFRVTLRDAEARADWIFVRAFAASRLTLLDQLGERNPVPPEEVGYLRATLERADLEIAARVRAGVPPAGRGAPVDR